MLFIRPVRVFADNYVWLIGRVGSADVAVIDPGDGPPVVHALENDGLRPIAVLVTHRHADHVGGVAEVTAAAPECLVCAPSEASVPRVDRVVADGDRVRIDALDLELSVMGLPGHTLGHVAFLTPGLAFVGDTLFAGGCGRVFEGTMAQMQASLDRLAGLPPATEIYCGHEYTVANLEFATFVEPHNRALAERLITARRRVSKGEPTVPSRIADELATNPFLRCHEPAIVDAARRRAGRHVTSGADTFAVIRHWKDTS